jgi:AraC family transcriptional regulator
MDVEVASLPALRVAAVRHVGPYHLIGAAFQRLGSIAGPAGLFQAPGAVGIGIYHDDPRTTDPTQLRSDAGVVIGEGAEIPTGLSEQRVPAGRYARLRHVGSYQGLPAAWERLMGAWLPSTGHRLGTGSSFEIYRNEMGTVPDDELITDIYVSIAS